MTDSRPEYSLHAEALAWLRYSKRMPIVVTESGMNADVLGISGQRVIEVEIKKSVADLRAEFRNKLGKHSLFQHVLQTKQRPGSYVPNWWYLFVDADIADKAEEILKENAPYGGLLVRHHPGRDAYHAGKWNCVVRMKPKLLHSHPPRPMLVRSAIMRMASELCGWHLLSGKKYKDLPQEEIKKAIQNQIQAVEGYLDHESPEETLEIRGRELSWVMTKKRWEAIPLEEKLIWSLRAQELSTVRRHDPLEINSEEIC